MPPSFLERHAADILGTYSCFDRIIIQGTLPDIAHADAMTQWFFTHQLRIFDFAEWAKPYRDRIRTQAETVASKAGIQVEFIRKIDAFRKEDRIAEILAKRGEHPGLVHVFSAMETCHTFQPWHAKNTHRTFFRYDTGRCVHYYFYFIDPDLGLCYLRVPTWAPFRLQFYCNGHNWLARRMTKAGIAFTQVENAFVNISDFAKAQALADACDPISLFRRLEQVARRYCDIIGAFPSGVHWSIMQLERATNIVFKAPEVLAPIYAEIVRTLSHAVRPATLTMFLGKPLDPRYEGELGSQFSTRIEGHCLRHFMGSTGLKIYDKFGRVLRIETFTNDVTFFKHHRKVVHRDGTACFKMASVRKSIFSLPSLAELMDACNRRYLEFLAAVDDPTNALDTIQKVSRPVRQDGRSYRGFNLFDEADEQIFLAVAQGQAQTFGFRNANLRARLGKTAAQISRICQRLRCHGLIKKAFSSYKYHLTALGKLIVAASLKLKEMVVIPLLRGLLLPSYS
jgi:hypothetical protein